VRDGAKWSRPYAEPWRVCLSLVQEMLWQQGTWPRLPRSRLPSSLTRSSAHEDQLTRGLASDGAPRRFFGEPIHFGLAAGIWWSYCRLFMARIFGCQFHRSRQIVVGLNQLKKGASSCDRSLYGPQFEPIFAVLKVIAIPHCNDFKKSGIFQKIEAAIERIFGIWIAFFGGE
jgi:hypothetical protein